MRTELGVMCVAAAFLAAGVLLADDVPATAGLTPINEMAAAARYKDVAGGLYGEGSNAPPAMLRELASIAAQRMRPLDPEGRPASSGAVVFMAIGNADAFRSFEIVKKKSFSIQRGSRHGLMLVNGAADGGELTDWVDLQGGSATKVWGEATRRLNLAGATTSQVQVVWILVESLEPGRLGEFPSHMEKQAVTIRGVIELAKARLPHLQVVFVSSGVYRGYAKGVAMTEPFGYEGAFAVRKAVLGQEGLSAAKREAGAVAVLWGPYLWADGARKRADALCWLRDDFDVAGRLLTDSGAVKVAGQLDIFLKTTGCLTAWIVDEPARKEP